MSYLDMSSELVGRLPGLDPFLADTFLNRAWSKICRARNWSFLEEICSIVCPVQVTAGSIAITQFSATVTCDAAASAALLAISLPSPLTLTALQIRFGGTGNTGTVGQVYSITAYDDTDPAAVVLTLDRVVVQATNAESGYQVYRAYIKPTVDDFLTWTGFVDMTNGWNLWKNFRSEGFDATDPQRASQGLAYCIGAFKGNPGTQPRPQYELWPHPVSGQVFLGRFKRQGQAFTAATDVQPPIIPDELIIEGALGYHAYRWAAENVGRIPQLKGPNYAQLMVESRREYNELLLAAKRQDNETQLQDVWARGHGLITGGRGGVFKGMQGFVVDSAYLQSHLVNF